MKIIKLLIFLISFTFCQATILPIQKTEEINVAKVLRLALGTVSVGAGILINGVMTKLDMLLMFQTDPKIKEYSYQVQQFAIKLQHFSSWFKYRATTGQVYSISTAAIVVVLINFSLCFWLTKKSCKLVYNNRTTKIAIVLVLIAIASKYKWRFA